VIASETKKETQFLDNNTGLDVQMRHGCTKELIILSHFGDWRRGCGGHSPAH